MAGPHCQCHPGSQGTYWQRTYPGTAANNCQEPLDSYGTLLTRAGRQRTPTHCLHNLPPGAAPTQLHRCRLLIQATNSGQRYVARQNQGNDASSLEKHYLHQPSGKRNVHSDKRTRVSTSFQKQIWSRHHWAFWNWLHDICCVQTEDSVYLDDNNNVCALGRRETGSPWQPFLHPQLLRELHPRHVSLAKNLQHRGAYLRQVYVPLGVQWADAVSSRGVLPGTSAPSSRGCSQYVLGVGQQLSLPSAEPALPAKRHRSGRNPHQAETAAASGNT